MLLDIIIIVLTLWGLYTGWVSGLLKQLAALLGYGVGLFIAALCYAQFGAYLLPHLGTSISLTNLIAFLLLWVIVPIFLGFVADNLTKVLNVLKLGLPNNLLGAAIGAFKFLLLLSCILNVMQLIGLVSEEKRTASRLYAPVAAILGGYFEGGVSIAVQEQNGASTDTTWVKFDRQETTH